MAEELRADGSGAELGEVDRRLADPAFLVNSFSSRVVGLLHQAEAPAARLAAAVYRQSVDLHRQAGAAVRRQVLALDAARFGDRALAARITAVAVPGEPAAPRAVTWATGAGVDHRFWPPQEGHDGPSVGAHHAGHVTAVATAVLDGRPLAVSGSEDGTVRCWDLSTGEPVGRPLTEPDGWVTALAIGTAAGRRVAVSGSHDGTVQVRDLATGRTVGTPGTCGTGPVPAVVTAVLAGRPVAVAGGEDGSVRCWDLTTGEPVGEPLTGYTDRVTTVATAEFEGRPVVVTGSHDGTLRVRDLASGRAVGGPLPADRVEAVATAVLAGRPVAVAGGEDGTVRCWDLSTGEPVSEPLTGHDGRIRALATTVLDGRPVAVSGGDDGTVRVWDLSGGRQLGRESVFPCGILRLATGPGGRVVAAFGHNLAVLARPSP
ncbi:WD40 repeat domain-containing protein [Kitasatospora sp. NPDC094015]|uniref:WD40 repeat domain-containing protein n=1 Tax=Kitasatospora sp. NPDC094015 TaxID=3155205 RepID=UPI00331B29C4